MPQPHRGTRALLGTRVCSELTNMVRNEARKSHLTVSDYIGVVLAIHLDREDLAPKKIHKDQEELPLTG